MSNSFPHIGIDSVQICELPPEACACFVVRELEQSQDHDELFKADDQITFVDETTDFLSILVLIGLFPSKGQARKNWNGPTEIPKGWTETVVGKGAKKKFVFLWRS